MSETPVAYRIYVVDTSRAFTSYPTSLFKWELDSRLAYDRYPLEAEHFEDKIHYGMRPS